MQCKIVKTGKGAACLSSSFFFLFLFFIPTSHLHVPYQSLPCRAHIFPPDLSKVDCLISCQVAFISIKSLPAVIEHATISRPGFIFAIRGLKTNCHFKILLSFILRR